MFLWGFRNAGLGVIALLAWVIIQPLEVAVAHEDRLLGRRENVVLILTTSSYTTKH